MCNEKKKELHEQKKEKEEVEVEEEAIIFFFEEKKPTSTLSLSNWRSSSCSARASPFCSPALLDLVLCSRVVDLDALLLNRYLKTKKKRRLSGTRLARKERQKHPLSLSVDFFSMSSSSSSSSANSAAAFAAGAALGTAAGYGLALWLLPYGGVSGALAELTDKERLADAFVSLKERFAKLTASLPPSSSAAAAAGEDGEAGKGGGSTAAPAPEAHPLSDPKMVLVVRRDLEMGKGKVGAQCGHAVREVFFFFRLFFFPGLLFSLEAETSKKLTLFPFSLPAPPPPSSSTITTTTKLFQAVGLYKKLRRARDDRLKAWEQAGATKVCLRVDDEVALLAVAEGARRLGLPAHVVADAGRTQVAAGSRTVLAVLGAGEEVDKLTGRLKLL